MADTLILSDAERALIFERRQAIAKKDLAELAADAPVSMADLTPEKVNAMKPEEHRSIMRRILAGRITD